MIREKIPNTPFWIVGSEEIGYKITWGKFTFNDEPIKTQEETIKWMEENRWQIVLHLIAIGITYREVEKKDTNKGE